MPARMAPVSVARSTRCVAPSRRAHHSASARISRPSASGLVTSTVRPAAVVMTSVGRIALPLSMFSQAGTIAGDRQRQPELGDRAQRAHDRGAAAHVGLLADDVRLRLEEVAARVERDGLADEPQPRAVRRAGRLVPEDDQQRPFRAARRRPRRGRRARPRTASMTSTVTPRERRCALGEPAGGDHVRRRVDELAGDVGPARDERGALGHGRELLAGAADRRSARRRAGAHRCASGARRSRR